MAIVHDFLLVFLPLFVVIDVAGTVPVFLALTPGYGQEARRKVAGKATVVAAVTGVLFVVLGQAFLTFLSIRVEDFQIAGGLLLIILAIVDLLSPGKPAVDTVAVAPTDDIAVVPLAVPLIVGPATMTTMLLLVSTYSPVYGTVVTGTMVCGALLLNLLLLFGALWFSTQLAGFLGKNTMAVINKIVMILLAGLAISLIRRGIVGIVEGIPGHG
jgi:multiple antibiotic resistance protein